MKIYRIKELVPGRILEESIGVMAADNRTAASNKQKKFRISRSVECQDYLQFT
jgi:hypothetical protein